ncbi:NAD(P)H-dependent oxidoreductase [Pantoea ananatis]
MLVVTMGGWESHYSPRGINGHIDDILFPIQHGILFYPGFDVLPPLRFIAPAAPTARALQHCVQSWASVWIICL